MEFEADVKFQKSNLPINFDERHRLIHENCKTTISWGWGKKGKSDDCANEYTSSKPFDRFWFFFVLRVK